MLMILSFDPSIHEEEAQQAEADALAQLDDLDEEAPSGAVRLKDSEGLGLNILSLEPWMYIP